MIGNSAAGNDHLNLLRNRNREHDVMAIQPTGEKSIVAELHPIVDTTRILEEKQVQSAEKDEEEGRRLSWMFSWVANHVHPPHPPPPHPHPHDNGGSGGGSGGSGSGSGGGSGGSGSGSGSGGSGSGSGGSGSGSGGGGGSGSGGSGSGSGGGGSGYSGSGGGGSGNPSGSAYEHYSAVPTAAATTMTVLGMVAAAAAIGAAIAAIAVGQRGRKVATPEAEHPLNGVLKKRINMFQKFAGPKFNDVPRPLRGGEECDYVAA